VQQAHLGEQEQFPITVVDNDGDVATVNLEINIDYNPGDDANRDIVLTNIAGDSVIEIPEYALLHNDRIIDNTKISSTDNAMGGTVSGTDPVNFVRAAATTITETSDRTSFEYTLDSDGNQDSTRVDIVGVNGTTITGSEKDEILIADSTNDTLIAHAGDDVLMGNQGDDSLQGGDGNDLLIGGQGDDSLDGGLGVDIFKWELNDQGSAGTPANDTIVQFDPSENGDKLDLSDLLEGEDRLNGIDELEYYLHFETQGANTVIHINTKGKFSTGFSSDLVEQSIVVENTDLIGDRTEQLTIIQNLLDAGKLITD
jgi:Ca2+-binding RTX toxin-like protein